MIKQQVFVYMSCMNLCRQLKVDIDIAKNMKRVYTISERLVSLTEYLLPLLLWSLLRASFHSERTKIKQRNQVGLTPAVKMSR